MLASAEEFHRYVIAAGVLGDAELQRAEEEQSLRHAEAQLWAKLSNRYHRPASLAGIPQPTIDYLRRCVFGLALKELLEKRLVRLPEGVSLPFSAIDEEVEAILRGDYRLEGLPQRQRLIALHAFPFLEEDK